MNFHKKSTLYFRRDLRQRSTFSERLVWSRLRNLHLGYRFKRQISIGKYIVDFYSPKAKLIVEIDGGYHTQPETIETDLERDAVLSGLGYEVLRFTNDEVLENLALVIRKIDEVGKRRLEEGLASSAPGAT